MGSEASGALKTPLVQQSPVKMLTSWYNGHNDFSWINGWHSSFIPSLYAKGYVLQLVVWSGDPEVNLNTRYGPACGRAYPVSSQFLQDMVSLAKTFQGNGSLYVSLFAEFSTYTCQDNQWIGNENYYRALKDQYPATFNTDVHAMFTNAYMAKVIANGLFGFGFMTNQNLSASKSPFTFVKNAVMNYARS
jgi:hypothetical protein